MNTFVSLVVLKLFIKSGGGKMLLEFLSVVLRVSSFQHKDDLCILKD